jgi:hypothetical protein
MRLSYTIILLLFTLLFNNCRDNNISITNSATNEEQRGYGIIEGYIGYYSPALPPPIGNRSPGFPSGYIFGEHRWVSDTPKCSYEEVYLISNDTSLGKVIYIQARGKWERKSTTINGTIHSYIEITADKIQIIGDHVLQKIIYEVEYATWGYKMPGFYIDTSGYVHAYNFRDCHVPTDSIQIDYYTETELYNKFGYKDSILWKVNPDSLSWSYTLARSVQPGEYSDTVTIGSDLGIYSFNTYLFDPFIMKYHKIILAQDGDMNFHNTSEGAITLTTWLKHIAGLSL